MYIVEGKQLREKDRRFTCMCASQTEKKFSYATCVFRLFAICSMCLLNSYNLSITSILIVLLHEV